MSTIASNDYAMQFLTLMQVAEDSDESELEDVVHAINAIYEESGHVLTDGKSPTAERQMIIFLYMLWDTYGSFLTNNYERFPPLFADMFSMFDEGGLESLVDMIKTLLTEWEKENIRLLRKEILSHDAEIFLILPADSGGTLRVPCDRKSSDLSYDEMVEDHLIIAGIYGAMLICRYEKDSKVSYALYRFRTSESGHGLIQAVEAPESGDICIHGFDTGEVEVIGPEHTEFKLLPFRLDAVLPVKDDVRGTIRVDAAPREMTVSEQFEFYHEVFCGKGFSDEDATLAALATMDEYVYLYPSLYYAGRAEELIRFTQLLNDDYFSEQVLRRLRTMWKDTEFGLPQLVYAATKETAAVLDSTDGEESLSPIERQNLELLAQHIRGINAEKELFLFTDDSLCSLTIRREYKNKDDEEKIAKCIWSRLLIAFRKPSIIILRMTTDGGKTYHVNGFFVREGKIVAMDNKEVAAFCLSEKDSILYTKIENEYYETALIDFAEE